MYCSFKLQFYVYPEDRWHPNYQNSPTPTPAAISNAASRLLAEDVHIPSDEPTQSTDSSPSSSSATTSPELPERPSTPATEPADSRPTTPRQLQLGDGFSVVPGPSRRLQRERPFSVAPDPMWNSAREINPFETLAAPAPPPPYVSPPTYAEVVPEELNDTEAAERIDMETATLQAPTLTVLHPSVLSSILPPAAVEEEEVEASLSANATTSTNTSTSTGSTDDSLISGLPTPVASSPPSPAPGNLSNGGDDASSGPSSPIASTSPAANLAVSEVEAVHDDQGLEPSSQLSEKARGKKRMREEDYTSDEEDEALERLLLGEGGSGHNPSTSGRDGQPDRKRIKTDTRINTDRLEVDEDILMLARMGLVEELTPLQRRRQNEKLKAIQKLYRSGRDSHKLD